VKFRHAILRYVTRETDKNTLVAIFYHLPGGLICHHFRPDDNLQKLLRTAVDNCVKFVVCIQWIRWIL